MSERKLFNAKNELFALMLFCESAETASEMMAVCRSDDWFALPWAKKAYNRIKELYAGNIAGKEGYVPFTALIADDELPDDVKDRLESGRRRFKEEKINKEAVIDSLERYRKFRVLNKAVEEANDMLSDSSCTDPNSIIELVEKLTSEAKVSQANVKDRMFTAGEGYNMDELIQEILSDDVKSYVPTGIKAFDDKNGGINYGSTLLIAGNTGGGKTLTAMNLAEHMALYEKVCYVPLEMTEKEMVQRQMAKHGRVPIHTISAKHWTEEQQQKCVKGYQKFHRTIKKQGGTLTIFKPDTDLTIDEIFAALHPYDYKVIYIDYISLLAGVDGDDAWRKLNEVCRKAKVYASTHNKIVVLLAQLNDEGVLRYSKGMLDHFNNAWFFVASQNSKESGMVNVTQPKARNSDPTPFELEIEYQYMAIGESSTTNVGVTDPEADKESFVGRRRRRKMKEERKEAEDEQVSEDNDSSEEESGGISAAAKRRKERREAARKEREEAKRSGKRTSSKPKPEPDDEGEDEPVISKRKPKSSGKGKGGKQPVREHRRVSDFPSDDDDEG